MPAHRRRIPIIPYLLAFGALAAFLAFERGRAALEAPNRDLSTYTVIARELLAGRQLYTDLWDLKPPAIYYTYALALAATDHLPSTYYLLSMAGALATMAAIAAAGAACRGCRAAGLWAAAIYAVIGSNLFLQANEPQSELFLNACVAGAFAILLRVHPWRGGGGRLRLLLLPLAAGLLLGVGSLYKTVVLAPAVGFGAVWLGYALRGPRHRAAGAQLALLALGSIIPWAAVVGTYAFSGILRHFYRSVFEYTAYYAAGEGPGVAANLIQGLAPWRLAPTFTWILWLPALLGLAGLVARGRRSPGYRGWLLAAYLLSTPAAVALPGQYAPHYYQLWLPPLCVGAAWAVAPLACRLKGSRSRNGIALAGGFLLICAMLQIPLYRLSPEEATLLKYGPELTTEARTAVVLDRLLKPGETFFHWGSAVPLYAVSGRRPPTGAFFLSPFLPNPLVSEISQRTLRQLEQRPAELVVLDARNVPVMPWQPVTQWIRERYIYLGRDPVTGRFAYYGRRGGRLANSRFAIPGELLLPGGQRPPQL